MLFLLSTALTLLLAGGPADNDKDNAMTLMDFTPRDLTAWNAVNDGVMGGLSRSYLRRTNQETAVFGGTVSLENNGGFASVRSRVPASDLSAFTGLAVRVRGDGRTYQLRLRSDDRFDGIPPIRNPGFSPASSRIQAIMAEVEVLPCVPETAMTFFPLR